MQSDIVTINRYTPLCKAIQSEPIDILPYAKRYSHNQRMYSFMQSDIVTINRYTPLCKVIQSEPTDILPYAKRYSHNQQIYSLMQSDIISYLRIRRFVGNYTIDIRNTWICGNTNICSRQARTPQVKMT